MRKNCSSDQEKLLKFKAEDPEFAKILRSLEQFILTVPEFAKFLRSLEQFILTVKGQNQGATRTHALLFMLF